MPRRVVARRRREDIGIRVNVYVQIVCARSGAHLARLVGHNIITDAGLAVIAAAIAGESALPTHFALGSSNTAATAADTALGTELLRPAIQPTNSNSVDEVAMSQYYLGSSTLNGQNIREAGLYVGSILIARFVFNEAQLQPKTNEVAAVFTWTFTFARA